MPGSPTSIASEPLPESAPSSASFSGSISSRRPTKAPQLRPRRSLAGVGCCGWIGVDGRAVEDAAQLLRDVLRRRRALVRRLREQAQDQRLERLRALGVVPRRGDGRRVDVLADHADGVVAEERRPAGHHLVEHRAERVEVAARVGRAAERLLGRHVGDGADHHALHRHARAVEGDGEAEVAERGVAVGVEPDVAGLEVAVDDAAAVRVRERLARPARRSSSRARAAMRCCSAFASRSSTEPPAM